MAKKNSYRRLTEINITSLVDVTLCLLIIFMLTAPYIQGGVEVDLPEAATRTQVKREGPVISITAMCDIRHPRAPREHLHQFGITS